MASIDSAVIESVVETLRDGRLFRYDCQSAIDSPVARLERAFAEYVGCRYAVAMNSCSSALFTALLCCGVRPGEKVLVPAFTFVAVPGAVVHASAQPVLVEMTNDYVIDCDDLSRKISPETKYLLLSHMRGRVSDMDRILDLCRRHEITLIEDCAHSLGALWNGVQTGRFGRAAAFSAQSYKIIDGGEGGFLVTDDRDIAFKAMIYSGCYEGNWRKHFDVDGEQDAFEGLLRKIPAYNFRMSNLTAAALLPQLGDIDDRVAAFNGLYDRIVEILRQSPNLVVPGHLPQVRMAADSLQFRINNLNPGELVRFQSELKKLGIQISLLGLEKDNARCFWNWDFFKRNEPCPYTRSLLANTADMRIGRSLDDAGAERLAQTIRAAAEPVMTV
jgi:perosamine synthetase